MRTASRFDELKTLVDSGEVSLARPLTVEERQLLCDRVGIAAGTLDAYYSILRNRIAPCPYCGEGVPAYPRRLWGKHRRYMDAEQRTWHSDCVDRVLAAYLEALREEDA